MPDVTTGALLALVGNPRPASRTAALARLVLDAVADRLALPGPRDVIDLGDLTATVGPPLGEGSAERYARPLADLAAARLIVVATPTYKGSYTGLLKSLLDHVPAGAWAASVAVPVLTVGGPAHSLAADVHLRPLLLELGAATPTASLVVPDAALADPSTVVGQWLDGAAPRLSALLGAGVVAAR